MSEDDLAKKVAELAAELEKVKAQLPKPAEPPKKREPWPRYDPTENMKMPPSAAQAMARVVPDIKDRKGFDRAAWQRMKGPGEPGGFGGPPKTGGAKPVEKGPGWENPRPLEPPPGVRICDQIADHFAKLDKEQMIADAIDRVRKVKG